MFSQPIYYEKFNFINRDFDFDVLSSIKRTMKVITNTDKFTKQLVTKTLAKEH